jgi:hypothetical protein
LKRTALQAGGNSREQAKGLFQGTLCVVAVPMLVLDGEDKALKHPLTHVAVTIEFTQLALHCLVRPAELANPPVELFLLHR